MTDGAQGTRSPTTRASSSRCSAPRPGNSSATPPQLAGLSAALCRGRATQHSPRLRARRLRMTWTGLTSWALGPFFDAQEHLPLHD